MSLANILNKNQPDIVRRQLIELLSQVDNAIQNGDLKYVEQIYSQVTKALKFAGDQVYMPLFVPTYATKGTTPDPDIYNSIFQALIADISVVFEELKYTGDIAVANFNRLVDEERSLTAWTKRIRSKLGDLTLFSSDIVGRSIYASDDFANYNKVEFDERFLLGSQAFVDVDQGLATLPRSATSPVLVVSEIKINETSNGQPGNNQQVGASPHDNVVDIIDDNPDTWWEYEKVNVGPSSTPLFLSLTLTLATEAILNYVRVNPNNFGTTNWVKIDSIETSVDDQVYTSIRKSLDIEGFGDILTDEDFELAPSNSRYAGQGIFTFTPRKAKYVRINFTQNEGYWIDNTQGRQSYRYAVGIRDIEINGINYTETGDVVSTPFIFTDPITKVSLVATENPIRESTLAEIDHFVTFDDGASWHQLQPLTGEDPDIAKIVNVNDGSVGAVETSSPALEVRHKATLKRLPDGFKDEKAAVQEELVETFDLRQIPRAAPYQITVENRPVAGSVSVVNPIFGAKGWNTPRLFVGVSDGTDNQQFQLDVNIREDEEIVYVDSQQWTRVDAFTTTFQYVLNYDTGLLRFGPDGAGAGLSVPDNGAIITIALPAERVVVEGQRPHTFTLENQSDGQKDAVEVVRFEPQRSVIGQILHPNASVMHLGHTLIEQGSVTFDEPNAPPRFGTEQVYVDGVTELSASDDYSIDYDNGIIHLRGVTWETGKTTVDYTYTPTVVVDPNFYDFVEGERQILELEHDAFISVKVESEDLSAYVSQRIVPLVHETIVRGSIRWEDGGVIYTQELPFIDGMQEFSNIVDVEDELVPDTGVTLFNLAHKPYSDDDTWDTALPVRFSDTVVFATEIDFLDPPPVAGEYKIDYSTGQVETGSPVNGGTVDYKFEDTTLDLTGFYSVDYREGIIWTNFKQPLPASSKVTYEYSNYAVKYRIARELSDTQFKVSPDDRLITILDPMVLEDYLPTTRQSGLVKIFYSYVEQVRESIEELEPFFTPVLKGYALKIITQSLL